MNVNAEIEKSLNNIEIILKKVEEYIKKTYQPWAMNYTAERSRGNYDDCFYDGMDAGESRACYEIAAILGIPLEEPKDIEEEEEDEE